MKSINNKSGAILLYSLLVVSLITAIAITISIIVVNGLKLAGGAANASMAYYAAESGIERGLYTLKVRRSDGTSLSNAILEINSFDDITLLNSAKYTDKDSKAKAAETDSDEIKQDEYTQMDYYDIEDPLDLNPPSNVIVGSINVQNNGNNPSSWAEVSWTAWKNDGTLVTDDNARKLIGPTDLSNGWTINLDVFSSFDPVGYRIRIKALFGDLSDVTITAYDKDTGLPITEQDFTTQVEVKSVGRRSGFKQSLTATVPWKLPLFGLYDYVLFSEENLVKTLILTRDVYNSGPIQVESNSIATCTGCSGDPGDCKDLGWLAVCCDVNASCNIGGSTDICLLDNIVDSSRHWVLPIPDYVPADQDYYLSVRAKYSNSSGNLRFILGDTCKEVPIQGATDEWLTCTIPQADFDNTSNTTIKFEQVGTGNIDIDWYQISTYKVFDDCTAVASCAVPTPECGNCLCETGESCLADTIACADDGTVCKVPSCTNGCEMVPMGENTEDPPDCDGGDLCCGGACITPACTGDPCDTDPDECNVYQCNNPGVCSASCDFVRTKTQAQGDCSMTSDGCCPAGCDDSNDADCAPSAPPAEEYLRYIARDESGNDLTALFYPGKSIRDIPAWQSQRDGGANDLRRVWAADQNNIWAVGQNGTILYSNDGGSTWTPQTSGTGNILRGIHGIDSSNIWVVGFNDTILYSNDGGSTWTPQTSGTSGVDLYGVWAADQNNVWAVGTSGTILYSSDGGANWGPQASGTSNTLRDIFGVDTSNIWTVGSSGTILYYNGSWGPQTSGTTSTLYGIDGTATASDLWAVGGSFGNDVILYSNNGGSNWDNSQSSPVAAPLYDVAVFDEYGTIRAVAVGLSGRAFYYSGSLVWSEQKTGIEGLFGAYAYNQDNIWAVGESEAIRYANAPGAHIFVDDSTDQYWYSKLYSSLDPPSGPFTVDLDVIRNTGKNNQHVYVTMQIGICTGGCDEITDFTQIGVDSSEVDIKGTDPKYYAGISLGSGDITCTNCRIWFRLWTSTNTGFDIDLLVSGREASYSDQLHRNSFIDIP